MNKKLSVFLALVLLATALSPVAALADARYGIIHGGNLRLRNAPDYDAAVTHSYPTGTWVEITGSTGTFYAVTAEDGRTGYMDARFVTLDTLTTGSWATVNKHGSYINLRTGPATSYRSIAKLPGGTRLEVLEYGEIFSKVRYDGDTLGYVSSGLILLDGETVWEEKEVHSDNGGKVNLRSGPFLDADVLGSYHVETPVTVLIRGRNWHKVWVRGQVGYMAAAFLDWDDVTSEPGGGDGWKIGDGAKPNGQDDPPFGSGVNPNGGGTPFGSGVIPNDGGDPPFGSGVNPSGNDGGGFGTGAGMN